MPHLVSPCPCKDTPAKAGGTGTPSTWLLQQGDANTPGPTPPWDMKMLNDTNSCHQRFLFSYYCSSRFPAVLDPWDCAGKDAKSKSLSCSPRLGLGLPQGCLCVCLCVHLCVHGHTGTAARSLGDRI